MREIYNEFVKFFISLRVTVVLLALSMILIFAATLDQVNLGIWAVQEKYFQTWIVLWPVKGFPIPVFPGGYFIGGMLLINLVVSHIYRFSITWKKTGILLTHAGLILLLIGELMTGLWQEEFQLRLDEGQSRNYSESYRFNELAIIDVTDPVTDRVVAIPESHLAKQTPIQHPLLPFRVVPKVFHPNATVALRSGVTNPPPAPASRDIGSQVVLTPLPMTYKQDERNLATAVIELIGPEGSLGTWMVSTMLVEPQTFEYGGRIFRLALRFERNYKPYSLTLLDFSHDRYAGTEIPKNFSSKIRLRTPDGSTDREVLIYMNNPLRFDGMTFYQQGFDNNDRTTVLQVVRNPSWIIPYISCALMCIGLLFQFSIHLVGFVNKRSRQSAAA